MSADTNPAIRYIFRMGRSAIVIGLASWQRGDSLPAAFVC
jgi:hypothetical protein